MTRPLAFGEAAKRRLDAAIHRSRADLAAERKHLAAYDELVHLVQARGTLLSRRGTARGPDVCAGLAALATHARDWLRPVCEWRRQHASPWVQFASLAEHLLARFPMPRFMASVWFDRVREHGAVSSPVLEDWYKRLGAGESIRTIVPCRLTRRMAHLFLSAPSHLTAVGAVRWAQVASLGGSRELAAALIATRLGRELESGDFWESVLRFFVVAPELDPVHVGPIVDFVHAQRALRPDFALKGRTAASVLRLVEEWHAGLGLGLERGETWVASTLRAFEWVDRVAVRRGEEVELEPRVWSIRELCSTGELRAEGRAMRHCVATYAARCLRRECSIWSMQIETAGARRRVLTIEVDMTRRKLCQARRKCNARPSVAERSVLLRWAEHAGLDVIEPLMA